MPHADCAVTTIAVHRGTWSDPDVAAMVTPPVTVSSMPSPARPTRGGWASRRAPAATCRPDGTADGAGKTPR